MDRIIANDVYTCRLGFTLAPALAIQETFYLNQANKTLRIKSISIDYEIHENDTSQNLPLDQNTVIALNLQVGDTVVPRMISKHFENFTLPVWLIGNGTHFRMWKPGQLTFDSWFIRNTLRFDFNITNYGVLLTYVINSCIIVETETIDNE